MDRLLVLAADISPMDIISHLPGLSEDHKIPYVFVPSKEELGHASSTKRPTSCVMICPNMKRKKVKTIAKDGGEEEGDGDDDDDDDDYRELYDEVRAEVYTIVRPCGFYLFHGGGWTDMVWQNPHVVTTQ